MKPVKVEEEASPPETTKVEEKVAKSVEGEAVEEAVVAADLEDAEESAGDVKDAWDASSDEDNNDDDEEESEDITPTSGEFTNNNVLKQK